MTMTNKEIVRVILQEFRHPAAVKVAFELYCSEITEERVLSLNDVPHNVRVAVANALRQIKLRLEKS